MYSRKSWGGSVDPFVLVNLEKQTPEGDADPLLSLVIFEWKDEEFVGVYPTPDAVSVRVVSSHVALSQISRIALHCFTLRCVPANIY